MQPKPLTKIISVITNTDARQPKQNKLRCYRHYYVKVESFINARQDFENRIIFVTYTLLRMRLILIISVNGQKVVHKSSPQPTDHGQARH